MKAMFNLLLLLFTLFLILINLDHIHLLFQYYPQLELPKFVGNIKSVTSRRLRQEFPEEINKVYWKKVLWNESYFIASCGGVTISVLKNYIENQQVPQ